MSTQEKLAQVFDNLKDLLIYKNAKYGDSAIKPINIFSKDTNSGSICIRLDDKLSRIRNSSELRKNDIADLIGYLSLLCVAKDWTTFDEFKD